MEHNVPKAPEGYSPSENEPYMNPIMLAYFENKLLFWKEKLLEESSNTKQFLEKSTERTADFTDEGIIEESRETEYSISQRNLDLMKQIDNSIERINNGDYGYCEETGQEIGVKRLNAWPVANLTAEVQAKKEKLGQ